MKKFRGFLIGLALGIVVVVSVLGGAVSDRLFGYRLLDEFFPREQESFRVPTKTQVILKEESVVIDVVERVSPSVVTVGITKVQKVVPFYQWDPFGFFGTPPSEKEEKIEQDIGSGFIISKDGLVVTNKHVVSSSQAKYRVITNDNKEYEVVKIYRDPANDLAILKINPQDGKNLVPVEFGDSDDLKVGQFAIAIGTALGEFRHTVTTGVISGIGRSITAGSPLEGYVEVLDNVIQTDAAINPGNSGGPLLNSAGQVIGVNVAVAGEAENIGFAIPINVVKKMLENFEKTGKFERAFLGVLYRTISREVAIMNEIPEGAYVVEVVSDSPAEKAGIKEGDIITRVDGRRISEEKGGLAKIISEKKVGETVEIDIWRNGEELKIKVLLGESTGGS